MKAAIAGTIAVIALASTAASIAGPTAKPQASTSNTAALDRKLKRLTARVGKLETRIKKVEERNKLLTSVAVITLAGVACEAAITADIVQRTWGVVDEIAQTTMGRTYFGQQLALSDYDACSDIRITRQQALPLAPFQSMINLFYGP